MGRISRTSRPPGPIRTLFDELRRLHRHAGEPSVRQLAANAGVSHATVHSALRGPRVPRWQNLELILEELHVDPDQVKALWVAARDAEDDEHDTPASRSRLPPKARLQTSPGQSEQVAVIGEEGQAQVRITREDRLAMVALFEEYFLAELDRQPTPRSYQAAANRLGWPRTTLVKRIEYLRTRLAKAGVPDMTGPYALMHFANYVLATSLITKNDIAMLTDNGDPTAR